MSNIKTTSWVIFAMGDTFAKFIKKIIAYTYMYIYVQMYNDITCILCIFQNHLGNMCPADVISILERAS